METFKLGKFVIEMVDNPSDTLNPQYKQVLITDCIEVARKAFRNEEVTDSDVEIHVMQVASAIFVRDENHRLVAFSSVVSEEAMAAPIVYLEGTAILPELQGSGFYGLLVAMRILHRVEGKDATKALVSTRTQSPLVFQFASRKLNLYPRINEATSSYIKEVAEAFAIKVRNEHSDFISQGDLDFDSETLVSRRAYGFKDENGVEHGFCMYGSEIPWSKDDEQVNEFIRSNLDLDNGDAILLIGPFDRERTINILQKSVKKIEPGNTALLRRFQ